MESTNELKKLINTMGSLLVLNTQVSMDGSIERKKNDILCKQRGVVKAINELKNLVIENARLEQKLASLEDIDDVAGDWKKLALDMQEAIVSIEAYTMDDNAQYFADKIKLLEEG